MLLPNENPENERDVYNGTENENGNGFTPSTKTIIAEVGLASGSVVQPLTDASSVINVANVTSGFVAAGAQAPQVPGNGTTVPSGCGSRVDEDEIDYMAIYRMATAPSFSNPQLYVTDNDPETLWTNFIDGDPNAGIVNDDFLGLERIDGFEYY